MAGTKAGGLKAKETNLTKYGSQFYQIIGAKGGRNGHTGGFAANRALAKIAGRKGGSISRRGPTKQTVKLDLHREEIFGLRDSGWTLNMFCEKYGVSMSVISRWFNSRAGR